MGEELVSCASVQAFRGANGSRHSGWGECQPGHSPKGLPGTQTSTTVLKTVGYFEVVHNLALESTLMSVNRNSFCVPHFLVSNSLVNLDE